ncbi:MAG: hypothetical protein ABFD96_15595, partial [Armatimonadia bacterium]
CQTRSGLHQERLIMTYDELSAAISATLENDFPATATAAGGTFTSKNQIDLFIRQAEQRIFNTVQFPSTRKTTTLTTTLGSPYMDLPTDFLAVFSMAVINSGLYDFLLNKDVSFIRQAYPNPSTTGAPRYYALFGPQAAATDLRVLLGPTPGAAYSVELQYMAYPQSIVDAPSGTSWLGDHMDAVLLAASILEAALFMKVEADLAQAYTARYEEALRMAKRMGDGLQRQDAYRSGQVRVPVN